MKKFRCIPTAVGLPVIFGILSFIWVVPLLHLDVFVNSKGEPDPVGGLCLCIFFMVFSLTWVFALLPYAAKRVEIYSNKIVCKGLFPRDTFEMEYDNCNIGMDYHIQNGGKIWWIYFYVGSHPKYKSKNPAGRINSLKIQPGFVRIMYSEELYQTLLKMLPPKKCLSLESIHRYSGFEKQAKIIL